MTDLLAARDRTGTNIPREVSAENHRSVVEGAETAGPPQNLFAALPAWPTIGTEEAETEVVGTGEAEIEEAETKVVGTGEAMTKEAGAKAVGTLVQAKTSQVSALMDWDQIYKEQKKVLLAIKGDR